MINVKINDEVVSLDAIQEMVDQSKDRNNNVLIYSATAQALIDLIKEQDSIINPFVYEEGDLVEVVRKIEGEEGWVDSMDECVGKTFRVSTISEDNWVFSNELGWYFPPQSLRLVSR